ncbi:MAG: hypothetical protein WBA68_06090 [Alteraurantiacibacter sp.]
MRDGRAEFLRPVALATDHDGIAIRRIDGALFGNVDGEAQLSQCRRVDILCQRRAGDRQPDG